MIITNRAGNAFVIANDAVWNAVWRYITRGYNTMLLLDGCCSTALTRQHRVDGVPGVVAFAKAIPYIGRTGENRNRVGAITYDRAAVLFNNGTVVFGEFTFNPTTGEFELK